MRARLFAVVLSGVCGAVFGSPPKNVILFVGDGMGHEAVKAAGYYFNGAVGQFSFEQLDHFAWMTHNNSSGAVTDSAASGTAMATGYKVNSGVISQALASGSDPRSASPSDGRNLQTLLETFKAQGKSTGLVTTSYITDATPAAFGAHAASRSSTGSIGAGYASLSQPNVVFGAAEAGFVPSALYTTVTNRAQMQAMDTNAVSHVAGLFGTGEFDYAYDQQTGSSTFYDTNPYLHEMTTTALQVLAKNNQGFFLLVENELTDGAGHEPVSGAFKAERSMYEVRELSHAVQQAIDFAATNPDTLILVTSDHETGSFRAVQNNGKDVLPTVTSGGTSHNATWSPLYASGPNAGHVFGKLDNTDIPRLATTASPAPEFTTQTIRFRKGEGSYNGTTDTAVRSDAPATANGGTTSLLSDVGSPTAQIAIRFDGVFDNNAIPADASIALAKLSVYTDNLASGNGTNNQILLHRLLVPFDDSTTWNTAGNVAGNGFSLNGAGTADDDYVATPEDIFPEPDRNAIATFDVTASLNAWLAAYRAGQTHSLGWMLTTSSTDGWQISSSEAAAITSRPMLEIVLIPEPATTLSLLAALPLYRPRRIRWTSFAG